jgi:hypothetical protein
LCVFESCVVCGREVAALMFMIIEFDLYGREVICRWLTGTYERSSCSCCSSYR